MLAEAFTRVRHPRPPSLASFMAHRHRHDAAVFFGAAQPRCAARLGPPLHSAAGAAAGPGELLGLLIHLVQGADAGYGFDGEHLADLVKAQNKGRKAQGNLAGLATGICVLCAGVA